jgi:hypothetical protein
MGTIYIYCIIRRFLHIFVVRFAFTVFRCRYEYFVVASSVLLQGEVNCSLTSRSTFHVPRPEAHVHPVVTRLLYDVPTQDSFLSTR